MHFGPDWWFDYGWVLMIIIWILTLLGFLFIIKMVFGRNKKDEGEISHEEFEEKKGDLT